ncbi:sensor histidine kinase [Salininema proteolyticum]|uniref:Sensor histidine kinase n=1 Tax=Salininema proteolyticum TaxID=1607685 RepID=A0ABV8TZR7_9ACTN
MHPLTDSPRRDLARLRSYTWLTLVLFPMFFTAGAVFALAPSMVDHPVRAVVAAALLLASGVFAILSGVQTLDVETLPLSRTHWLIGIAVWLAAVAVTYDAGNPFPWALAATGLGAYPLASAGHGHVARRLSYFGLAVMAVMAVPALLGRMDLVLAPVGALLASFMAWSTWTQVWNYRVAVQLEEARGLAADLAVADERLRFAAELHDIQGHNLQAITLKAELARRLMAADPEAAAAQLNDIESLARQGLSDTRELVTGYREITLATEVENAARILTSAGIAVDLDAPASLEAAPDRQKALGLLVREATTNILRHSEATRAALTLEAGADTIDVVIVNDGAPAPGPHGNGLAMLEERFREGTLATAWDGGEFTVSASLPAERP